MAEVVKIPCTLEQPTTTYGRAVMLIGVGGIGARMAAPILKLLRAGDHLYLIDADVVEERNLIRQHFTASDVGLPKAEAVGRRLQAEAGRIGASVHVIPEMVTVDNVPSLDPRRHVANMRNMILISSVDTRGARRVIRDFLLPTIGGNVAWIDAGNRARSGQVLMDLLYWSVSGYHNESGWERPDYQPGIIANTIRELQPDLLDPDLDKADSDVACGLRFDIQTVGANQMAAAIAIDMASWLLDELPISSLGARYSLDGPSVVSYPIWRVWVESRTGDLRASASLPVGATT